VPVGYWKNICPSGSIKYWHRTNQLSVEQEAIFNNNIVDATMWIFLFEYLEGKLTEQDKII
jgi:hypothetical protein